jgi:hypothetical protein
LQWSLSKRQWSSLNKIHAFLPVVTFETPVVTFSLNKIHVRFSVVTFETPVVTFSS